MNLPFLKIILYYMGAKWSRPTCPTQRMLAFRDMVNGVCLFRRNLDAMEILFVGNVGRNCVCQRCSSVYRKPVAFKGCLHVFCAECAWCCVATEHRCYICATPVTKNDIISCTNTNI